MLNQTLPLSELSICPRKVLAMTFSTSPKHLELQDENHAQNLCSSSVTKLLILEKLVCAGRWTSSGAFLRNKDDHKPAGLSQDHHRLGPAFSSMEAWPYRDFQCTSKCFPSFKTQTPGQNMHPAAHTFPATGIMKEWTHTRGRCWARRSVHNIRVLRYINQELSSLTQMRPTIFMVRLLSKNALSRQNSWVSQGCRFWFSEFFWYLLWHFLWARVVFWKERSFLLLKASPSCLLVYPKPKVCTWIKLLL